MRLRNKKTGEIVTIGQELGDDFDGVGLMLWVDHVKGYELDDCKIYGSLSELNEEWEDYEPTEPLIKDPKIRKAVRAWAEANDVEKLAVLCHSTMEESVTEIAKIDNASLRIVFPGDLEIKRGYTFTDYTITELCGEEEE